MKYAKARHSRVRKRHDNDDDSPSRDRYPRMMRSSDCICHSVMSEVHTYTRSTDSDKEKHHSPCEGHTTALRGPVNTKWWATTTTPAPSPWDRVPRYFNLRSSARSWWDHAIRGR